MSKQKKVQKVLAEKEALNEGIKQVVKMKFYEDKFYNDPAKAHFEKGKVYEVKGADQIQRWLKRGGVIVEGQLEVPEQEVNPSVVVEDPAAEVDSNVEAGEGDDSQEKEE